MRIGITGGSGLIGGALICALEARGDTVIRFVRPDSSSNSNEAVRWDPSRDLVDEGDLRRVAGFDAVVHLAGAGIADKRWSSQRKQEIMASRVRSTKLLVSALSRVDTAILASGSAIGVYGSRGDQILDESAPRGSDFLASVCANWEDATQGLEKKGATVAHLRTGIVMSCEGGALKKQLPLFRLGLGGALATGQQWLSPISITDEVRAIIWVIDQKLSGPVNLTAPEPVRNLEFTKVLAQEIHRPAFFRVPATALKIALGTELASEAVLASQRVIPKVLEESGFSFANPTIRDIISSSLAT